MANETHLLWQDLGQAQCQSLSPRPRAVPSHSYSQSSDFTGEADIEYSMSFGPGDF